ncbi:hypothetical protein O3P69_016234 [Scylla paramamosain]|uniref:Secreted protein n=1 Tax=Scylla paramamosain TaxID=85552 RepID=A0AAW0S9U3_SCYPA
MLVVVCGALVGSEARPDPDPVAGPEPIFGKKGKKGRGRCCGGGGGFYSRRGGYGGHRRHCLLAIPGRDEGTLCRLVPLTAVPTTGFVLVLPCSAVDSLSATRSLRAVPLGVPLLPARVALTPELT